MGFMKDLYIQIEELSDQIVLDLGLAPYPRWKGAAYTLIRDKITEWVDRTFLNAPEPTVSDGNGHWTERAALEAIIALVTGDHDNPALVQAGPINWESDRDVERIANLGLAHDRVMWPSDRWHDEDDS